MPESPHRPKEESPTMLTALGTLSRSHQQATPMPSHKLCPLLQKHLILIISRPTCTTYFKIKLNYTTYTCIFQFHPHRMSKLLSSQCNCNGSWFFSLHSPEFFSLHSPDGALFQPPDRRHTVKQRGLPLAWSSLKFYPLTPAKLTG